MRSHQKGVDPLAEDRSPEAITGGALINLDGELIGLTSATAIAFSKPIGPGFAIPMDAGGRRIVEVLRKGEEVEYGFVGISASPDLRIEKISPHGPAHDARLWTNEQITAIDGQPARNFEDLLLLAGNALAGTRVTISVRELPRPGELEGMSRSVTLTLGKFRNTQPFIASVRPDPVFGLRVDYLSMLIQQDGPQSLSPLPIRGVCVRELVPDSPAAVKFKTLGDNPAGWIITHVNGKAVATPADFYAAAKGQATVKLTLRDWGEGRRELTLP